MRPSACILELEAASLRQHRKEAEEEYGSEQPQSRQHFRSSPQGKVAPTQTPELKCSGRWPRRRTGRIGSLSAPGEQGRTSRKPCRGPRRGGVVDTGHGNDALRVSELMMKECERSLRDEDEIDEGIRRRRQQEVE
uniref:Uncharacterized protein n=1 Tax=Leersia perrieri TaxID=77586 RepID=A0A0D9VTY0_9ORYZ